MARALDFISGMKGTAGDFWVVGGMLGEDHGGSGKRWPLLSLSCSPLADGEARLRDVGEGRCEERGGAEISWRQDLAPGARALSDPF